MSALSREAHSGENDMAYLSSMQACRFCKKDGHHDQMVKYGIRHYAHHACYLDNKALSDLHKWQIENFPFRLLKERGLLDEVERLIGDRVA